MSGIFSILFVIVAAYAVILCGLKLFDISSELAEPIRRYGMFAGVFLAVITILGFLLSDISDITDGGSTFLAIFLGTLTISAIEIALEFLRARILSRRKAKKLLAKVTFLDSIDEILVGLAVGISFIMSFGSGVMTLCAVILFQICTKVESINLYQKHRFGRRDNLIALLIPLGLSLVTAIVTSLLSHGRYIKMGIFLSFAISYLLYLCIRHLYIVVKKHQKR